MNDLTATTHSTCLYGNLSIHPEVQLALCALKVKPILRNIADLLISYTLDSPISETDDSLNLPPKDSLHSHNFSPMITTLIRLPELPMISTLIRLPMITTLIRLPGLPMISTLIKLPMFTKLTGLPGLPMITTLIRRPLFT